MTRFQCYRIEDPDTLWLYCPSYSGAIAFSVLFGLTTLAHIIQAFWHRKPFLIVLIMGGIWELGGYISRVFSSIYQKNEAYMTIQQILIILAPLWINAFCYMCLGRMIHCFLPAHQDRVFGLRSRRIGTMFVLADIAAFLVQLTGAMMLGPDMSASVQKIGLNVYMGGVGLQLFFIAIFICIAIKFQLIVRRDGAYCDLGDATELIDAERAHGSFPTPEIAHASATAARGPLKLLYTLYAVLILIVFRNLYRLVEFSAGMESSITKNEWYTWVFDSVPMFIALALFNFFHPGRFLQGDRADFSQENKEKKAAKKQQKEAKKMAKQQHNEAKKAAKAEKKAAKACEQ